MNAHAQAFYKQQNSFSPLMGLSGQSNIGRSAAPPAFQLQASSSQAPIQRKMVGTHDWMQGVSDSTIGSKVGGTTAFLWKAIKKLKQDVAMNEGSPSFNFSTFALKLPSGWYEAIQNYIESGTKGPDLGRALSALTHEMSHAHDRLVLKDSPKGASKDNDDFITATLRTELKAWWKEAKSSRENKKSKAIDSGPENSNLVVSWLGTYYSLQDGKDIMTANTGENAIAGRLERYFFLFKSKKTTTTLQDLLDDSSNGLMDQITDYAADIKGMFTSPDLTLRNVAKKTMATGKVKRKKKSTLGTSTKSTTSSTCDMGGMDDLFADFSTPMSSESTKKETKGTKSNVDDWFDNLGSTPTTTKDDVKGGPSPGPSKDDDPFGLFN